MNVMHPALVSMVQRARLGACGEKARLEVLIRRKRQVGPRVVLFSRYRDEHTILPCVAQATVILQDYSTPCFA